MHTILYSLIGVVVLGVTIYLLNRKFRAHVASERRLQKEVVELQQERNAILNKYKWERGFGGTISDAIDAATTAAAGRVDG